MRMNLHKRSCLKRARSLVADPKPESLRYACLEIRYCVEAIAYEKLRLYEKNIPKGVLEIWQPRKVIDVLEEYDPLVNQSYTLRIWSEKPSGERDKLVFSGEHKTLSPAILKKHYNKLGGYLHVPTPAQVTNRNNTGDSALKDYLEVLIQLLEASCNNTFDSNIAEVVNFECQQCGQPIIRNKDGLEKNPSATCLSENCQAQHDVYQEEGQYYIRLRQAEFICPDCQTTNYLPFHQMEEGSRLSCVECDSQYVIDRRWVCVRVQTKKDKV